jgi:hypothetical protein
VNRLTNIAEVTEKQLVRLFEDVLSTLPPSCASLELKPASKDKDIHELAIVPVNESSAEFGVILMSGDLYAAFFGRGKLSTTYECPWEIGLSRRDGLTEHLAVIEKMSLAVIAGRCEHLLGRMSIRGTIHVSEKEAYRVTDIPKFPPRRERRIVQYDPYCPGAENHSRSFPRVSL